MSEAPTQDAGPLSFEQAVASLTRQPAEEQAEEAPTEAAEGNEIEAEASPAEDAQDGAENPAEGETEEPAEEAETPLDPPLYWKPEAKEAFASLPPAVQAEILAQEGPREEAAAKAKAEAAKVAQQAQAEIGKVQQLADHLAGFLPQAVQAFQNKWGSDPDWIAYANEHGVEAMTIAKVQHDQDLALLRQTYEANERAQAEARQATVKAEFATLAEIAPDLVDPEKGAERRTEITKYLIAEGLEPDNVRDITAKEMVLARKAMLWDQAQAAAKAAPKPKPITAPAQRSPVRPAAGQTQSSQQRTAAQTAHRFAQTRSVDDAVALLLAKKG